ncbi:hypothetical protein S83_009546, partial [Arachis hypogaea]
ALCSMCSHQCLSSWNYFQCSREREAFKIIFTSVTPHMVLIIDKGSEVSLCQLNTNSSSTATHDGTIYVQ